MRISKKLNGASVYGIDEVTAQVVLNANESFLTPSPALSAALTKVLTETPLNRYPDPLARRLCAQMASFYHLEGGAMVCGNGSDELIQLIFSCLIDAGDKVLTLQPDFSMYHHYAHMSGVEICCYEKPKNRVPDVAAVLDMAQKEDVAMVVFSNPCNPTGVGLTRQEVLSLTDRFDGLVVVDEAYMDFWHESVAGDVPSYDNLIVLKTASKAMALASLRIGLAVTNERLAHLMMVGKSPYNVGGLVQALATEVYKAEDELRANTEKIKKETAALMEALKDVIKDEDDVTLFPSCTNFIYMESPRAEAIFQRLRDEGVLVRFFKKPKALRITCGTERENNTLIKAFCHALKEGEQG